MILDSLVAEYPYINNENYVNVCEDIIKNIIHSSITNRYAIVKNKYTASAALPDINDFDKHQAEIALNRLKVLYYEKDVLFIHYACTNFDDPILSPRITCIAITFLNCSDIISFSYNQPSIENEDDKSQQQQSLDNLEYKLLSDFFNFVRKHKKAKWIHWNMRDSQFGFCNIENRYQTFGGKIIPITNTIDLAYELKIIYGHDYVPHKRLMNICKINDISMLNFIDGENEAKAANTGNYRMILNSTLRKVSCIKAIFEKIVHNTLKTAKDSMK